MATIILKNDKLWMESDAVDQLESFSKFEGVLHAVGLPDLHSGKVPVGTTFQTKDIIYPFFIGNDIGCGMSLFDTNIKLKKINRDRVVEKLKGTSIHGEYSIGGGNHFAEFQCVDKIYQIDESKKINLDKKHLYLLVHSGSRNFGQTIYEQYVSTKSLKKGTELFDEYMKQHQKCIQYAKNNRIGVAHTVLEYLGMKYNLYLVNDTYHNYIEMRNDYYFHHKGSISSFNEYAVIAGSRGNYSYLVKCYPKKESLYSISHGSGRKWARNLCMGKLTGKYTREQLQTSKIGGRVIVNDKSLLYEEASEAYKNIDDVIHVLLEYGVIELVARLKPIITYKN